MSLNKPPSVSRSPFQSAKWDELTKDRNFSESDIPTLSLLCQWHEVVDKCMDDISIDGSIQVAYSNDMGDIKALPQLSTMKQASAEIRALNKQLGINDEATAETKPKETKLVLFQTRRQSKAKNSA